MRILVTGAAGFIGFHVSRRLLDSGAAVIGIDNLNDYYDPSLKKDRLAILEESEKFSFHKVDLKDKDSINHVFQVENPEYVINLAAQAGVRYSIENPYAYVDSNLIGFMNILEACRHYPVKHLLYASSSSVYGGNTVVPFSEDHSVDHPVSLYAATKKSNELMAHTYSHLFGIPTTGLRFFTVYGPWGRPDMAYFSFTNDILAGNPIKVFNHGQMERDFTYVDDVVDGIVKLLDRIPSGNPEWEQASTSFAPYRIFNIGNNKPVQLMTMIHSLEQVLGKEAQKIYMDMQPGDVLKTYADISGLQREVGFNPVTDIQTGLERFAEWYKAYYEI